MVKHIFNILSVSSFALSGGIIASGVYVYANREAIIDERESSSSRGRNWRYPRATAQTCSTGLLPEQVVTCGIPAPGGESASGSAAFPYHVFLLSDHGRFRRHQSQLCQLRNIISIVAGAVAVATWAYSGLVIERLNSLRVARRAVRAEAEIELNSDFRIGLAPWHNSVGPS